MSSSVPIGQMGSITDAITLLGCGCKVVFLQGNLQDGRLNNCPKHSQEPIFSSLKLVEQIAMRIKNNHPIKVGELNGVRTCL